MDPTASSDHRLIYDARKKGADDPDAIEPALREEARQLPGALSQYKLNRESGASRGEDEPHPVCRRYIATERPSKQGAKGLKA